MSINLVSLASQYITPEIIGRVSSTLGIDRTIVGKALTALVPGLLRVLAGLASTPLGAQRLAGAIDKQEPGLLNALHSESDGTELESLAKNGIGSLESLLGGSALSALSGAVSKFAGLSPDAALASLGLVTPTTLGTLQQEKFAQGLDATGLSHLLASQSDNIAEALPPEFGKLLATSGVPGFSPAHTAAAEYPTSTPSPAPASAVSGSRFNWRLVTAAIAAIALISALYLANRSGPAVEQTTTPPAEQTKITGIPGAPNLVVNGVDLNSSVKTAFGGLQEALQSITNSSTAQTALPQLQKQTFEIDKLRDLASKLPIDAKSSFALVVTQLRPSIEDLFNKVLALPGVAPIAKPIIDNLRSKLDALSKTESKA